MILIALTACGNGSLASSRSGSDGSLVVQPTPTNIETFKFGQLTLGPMSTPPAASEAEVLSRLRSEPMVVQLLTDGYQGTVQYGGYTNLVMGTSSSDSGSGDLTLTYRDYPAWTVRFEQVDPVDASAFVGHGPPTSRTTPSAVPETFFLVFSSDGQRFLDGHAYPSS